MVPQKVLLRPVMPSQKHFKLIFSFCPGFGREGLNIKKRNNLIVRKYEDT